MGRNRVLLGVGGGIAAYKSAELARLLMQRDARVQVVMTKAAQEFIQPLTFASLTGQKVITGLFSSASAEDTLSSAIEHIAVAQDNDLLVIAPATADLLAKFALGLVDDFLSTLYLAFTGPVVLAPAMNANMWSHAATEANAETLRRRGHHFVEPGSGYLACGMTGSGRLAEPEQIADAVLAVLHPRRDLEGEIVLITAGPTQEPLDPVRYISNRSSGKMGYALAQVAAARGARVILVSGPVNIAPAARRIGDSGSYRDRNARGGFREFGTRHDYYQSSRRRRFSPLQSSESESEEDRGAAFARVRSHTRHPFRVGP